MGRAIEHLRRIIEDLNLKLSYFKCPVVRKKIMEAKAQHLREIEELKEWAKRSKN